MVRRARYSGPSFETAKLAFADSDIVLIADASDLNDFYSESFGKLKSFSAGEPLSAIRVLPAVGRFYNDLSQLFPIIHTLRPPKLGSATNTRAD
jgi:hypothetical protein